MAESGVAARENRPTGLELGGCKQTASYARSYFRKHQLKLCLVIATSSFQRSINEPLDNAVRVFIGLTVSGSNRPGFRDFWTGLGKLPVRKLKQNPHSLSDTMNLL
ncbi:MAG: hypothetical protein ABL936_00185 [Aestuariivirga sp.]